MREPRHPERDVDLDVDRAGLDAEDRGRSQAREHGRTVASGQPDIQSFLQRLSGWCAESATPHAPRSAETATVTAETADAGEETMVAR